MGYKIISLSIPFSKMYMVQMTLVKSAPKKVWPEKLIFLVLLKWYTVFLRKAFFASTFY